MTVPYVDVLKSILAERGVELPEANIQSAAATHEKLRHEFEKLHSVELRFLPPYIEPATATRWIESFARQTEEG
ncbi:MAG: hypothetical protein ACR2NT_16620 [Acidimicrobiia bacterium]